MSHANILTVHGVGSDDGDAHLEQASAAAYPLQQPIDSRQFSVQNMYVKRKLVQAGGSLAVTLPREVVAGFEPDPRAKPEPVFASRGQRPAQPRKNFGGHAAAREY